MQYLLASTSGKRWDQKNGFFQSSEQFFQGKHKHTKNIKSSHQSCALYKVVLFSSSLKCLFSLGRMISRQRLAALPVWKGVWPYFMGDLNARTHGKDYFCLEAVTATYLFPWLDREFRTNFRSSDTLTYLSLKHKMGASNSWAGCSHTKPSSPLLRKL